MMEPLQRIFLALIFSESLHGKLQQSLRLLRQLKLPIKWTEDENLHLTLKFWGETERGRVDELRQKLPLLLENRAPRLVIDSFGVFPNSRAPRVLWLGIQEENQPCLITIFEQVEMLSRQMRLPLESKAFHPHITLGRVRHSIDYKVLEKFWKENHWEATREIPVAFKLLQSTLTSSGAVYQTLLTIPCR